MFYALLFVGAQQDIRVHSVTPHNVSPPQTDQPQHTADSGIPIHSHKTEADSHSYKTTTANTTTSSSVLLTGVGSAEKESM